MLHDIQLLMIKEAEADINSMGANNTQSNPVVESLAIGGFASAQGSDDKISIFDGFDDNDDEPRGIQSRRGGRRRAVGRGFVGLKPAGHGDRAGDRRAGRLSLRRRGPDAL